LVESDKPGKIANYRVGGPEIPLALIHGISTYQQPFGIASGPDEMNWQSSVRPMVHAKGGGNYGSVSYHSLSKAISCISDSLHRNALGKAREGSGNSQIHGLLEQRQRGRWFMIMSINLDQQFQVNRISIICGAVSLPPSCIYIVIVV
jgi:hypothetical protein